MHLYRLTLLTLILAYAITTNAAPTQNQVSPILRLTPEQLAAFKERTDHFNKKPLPVNPEDKHL